MTRTDIEQEYFGWMCGIIKYCDEGEITFMRLLSQLHDTEFYWIIPKDANRAEDGEDLRDAFAYANYPENDRGTIVDYLSRPCSVLEMILALAIRMEDIMDDFSYGDRTSQWFWQMIVNLGLGGMYDSRYDEDYVDEQLNIFMNREYEANGRGGLFYMPRCEKDLRDVELWISALWYLDTL